jgi:hypothetical protein
MSYHNFTSRGLLKESSLVVATPKSPKGDLLKSANLVSPPCLAPPKRLREGEGGLGGKKDLSHQPLN